MSRGASSGEDRATRPADQAPAGLGDTASVPCAVAAVIDDINAYPTNFGGNVLASIAVSLKRMVEMMEEDRKPHIELAPEGYVSDQEHRQILRDGLERDGQTWARIADTLEALTKARGES